LVEKKFSILTYVLEDSLINNLNELTMSFDGVKHYTDAAKRAMDWHSERKKEIRKQRFGTIAVHGVYSMQEALDFNQGSIIEPIYVYKSILSRF